MPARSFRDLMADRVNKAKTAAVEALVKRLGPPPSTAAGVAMKNDEYRAFWKTGKGWEDPQRAEAMAQAMVAQGAKPADIMQAQYPERVGLIAYGERRDNLKLQVEFCEEMARQRAMKAAELLSESMKVMEQAQPEEQA